MEGFPLLIATLTGAAVLLILLGAKTVPQGQNWTVERFGRYIRTLDSGLHIIIPIFDRVGAKLSMMETVLDVPTQEVISRDNCTLGADAVVFYQVVDAAKASYAVRDLRAAMLNLAMTNVRTVMGSMELDDLLSQRDAINTQLLKVVDEATAPWGVKVTRIDIRDIQPPRDLVDSMARQMKAERDRRAVILEAEGQRQAAILRAEGEKQAAILQSEGRREAAYRDAEARERQAEAEAKATAAVAEAVKDGGQPALNYFIAQRYVDSLRDVASAPNAKLVLMPLDASGVVGAVGGVAEIVRSLGAK